MDWIEIRVPVNEESREIISTFLFEQKSTGCVDEGHLIISYFKEEDFHELFMSDLLLYLQKLEQSGISINSDGISVKKIPDQEWNRTWREQFKPVKVSPRFVVAPPWLEYSKQAGETVILIDPKMAFGTGSHATTQLILRATEKYLTQKMRVLDLGTGTGILAIVACQLGADFVLGVDNDPVAIECARESLELNHCEEKIKLQVGTVEDLVPQPPLFDVVLANIQQDVILKIIEPVRMLLVPGGLFIVSGILIQEMEQTIFEFKEQHFHLLDQAAEDEWCALVFQKTSDQNLS